MENSVHMIGRELQQAREEKDMSLEQISEKTRISLEYLQKIEAGEFDFLPRPYVTAYIKLFAGLVGLDGDELLNRWKTEARAVEAPAEEKAGTAAAAPDAGQERNLTEENQRTYVREISIGIGAVVILLITLYVLQETPQDKAQPELPAAQKQEEPEEIRPIPFEDTPVQQSPRPAGTAAAQAHEAEPEQPAPVLEENIRLRIQAVDTVWVAVTDAEGNIEEAIFRPGDIRTWKGPNFIVNIGNAAGLKLFVDGEDQGELGRKGQVRIFEITREGLKPVRRPRVVPRREAESDTSRGF